MNGILIPLGAALIAILVVAALWLWWSGDAVEPAPSQAEPFMAVDSVEAERIPNPPMPISAPTSAVETTTHAQPTNELMRVLTSAEGGIAVMVGGRVYDNVQEISGDPALHNEFLKTVRAVAQFAQETGNVSESAAVTASSPAPAYPYVPVRTAAASSTAKGGTAGAQATAEADEETQTVAGQIEKRLQERLAQTPAMQHRSIHIYSTLTGGVEIKVDNLLFESVGDITDSDARAVIEAAIRDWETGTPI